MEQPVNSLNNLMKWPSAYRKAIVIVRKVIVGRVPLNKLLRLLGIGKEMSEIVYKGHAPTVWISANYAKNWYLDALAEVSDVATKDNKRREIVFSVCFLESYIYEWVRNKDIQLLKTFFGDDAKNSEGKFYSKSLKEKWKYIPPDMISEFCGDHQKDIDLSDLGVLIGYRNGFVHGGASKPSNNDLKPKEQPKPKPEEIDCLKSGWAIRVATKLVISLHDMMNTSVPEYIN